MRRCSLLLTVLLAASMLHAAPPATPSEWRAKITEAMPLFGHRNWILIVDSAYPLQASPGVETVVTNADQLEVLRHVLGAIDRSIHVRPIVLTDAELPFVPEEDAPGVGNYRNEINDLLRPYPRESQPHGQILADIEEASKHFNVLVLKTNMAIPYTSIFIRLDCKYWSADAEKRLRAKIAAAGVAQ